MSPAEVIMMAARRPPTAPEDYEAMREELVSGFAELKGIVGELRADVRNLSLRVDKIIHDREAEAPAIATAKGVRWAGMLVGTTTLTGLIAAAIAWALGWIGRK